MVTKERLLRIIWFVFALATLLPACAGAGGTGSGGAGSIAEPPKTEEPVATPAEPTPSEQTPPAEEQPGEGQPPEEQPAESPRTSRSRELDIQVTGQPEGTAGIELWFTLDEGNTWSRDSITKGTPEWIRFSAQRDGTFGFKLVPVDKMGRPAYVCVRGTTPDATVIVDSQPPVVVLESPNGGNVYRNLGTDLIKWTAVDNNLVHNSVLIEGSGNGGQTWAIIARDVPNDGRYFWRIPSASSQNFRVRVSATDIAGNTGTDGSDADFAIDGLPPEGQILGPPASTRSEVDVKYRAGDLGGAGLARIDLWASTDSGVTWERVAEDDDTLSPVKFRALDGTYLLWLVCVDSVGNASDEPPSGARLDNANLPALIVDSQPPEVKLTSFKDGGIYAGDYDYDITFAIADTNLAANPVKIEYSTDGGSTWREIASGLDHKKPAKWHMPSENYEDCRLRVTANDLLGNVASDVTQGFAVDALVPEAVVIGPGRSSRSEVEITYEIRNRGVSPMRTVELWYTTDNGTRWHRYGEDVDRRSPVGFKASDGDYGLAVVCASTIGAEIDRSQRPPANGDKPKQHLIVDTMPPVVELLSFKGGEVFRGNSDQVVLWTAQDAHLGQNCVSIEYSPNSGANWAVIVRNVPNEGRHDWKLPVATSSTYRLRVTVCDAFGNISQCISTQDFGIDSVEPKVVACGPCVSGGNDVEVSYTVIEDIGPAGLDEVEVWYSNLSSAEPRWDRVGVSRVHPTTLKLRIDADGRYGIKAVGSDKAGNRGALPATDTKPDFEVLVDTKKPRVELLTFRGGECYQGGATLEVKWKAEDSNFSNDPISLEFSPDDGRTWQQIRANMPNTSGFLWELPLESGERYRIRVVARDAVGNESIYPSDASFSIDSQRPDGRVKGPATSKTQKVSLAYEVQDFGKAGLKGVEIWYRPEGDKAWRQYPKEFTGSRPLIEFEMPDGKYGLWLCGIDKVNNVQHRPTDSDSAQSELVIDSHVPLAEVVAPAGEEVLMGGSEFKIKWVARDDNLIADFIILQVSSNGGKTWEPIAAGLPNSGEHVWRVKEENGDAFLIKVVATDVVGNVTESVSRGPFKIDSLPPVAEVVGPRVGNSSPVGIAVRASDAGPAGLGAVELHVSTDGGASWNIAVTETVSPQLISLPLEDGLYGLSAVAVDKAGNRSRMPTIPQCELLVDTKKPTIFLRGIPLEPGTALFKGGDPVTICWEAADDNLAPRCVGLRIRDKKSDKWTALVEGEAPVNTYTWTTPKTSGEFVLEVSAADRVGNSGAVEVMLEIDADPPVVTLGSFRDGGEFAGTRSHDILWEASDAHFGELPISIWFSQDGGANWAPVAKEVKNSGKYHWTAPTLNAYGSCLVKVQARDSVGNFAESVSDKKFTLVSSAPAPRVRVPRITKETKFAADIELPAGSVALDTLEIWVTSDNGVRWQLYKKSEKPVPASVELSLPDGRHGIWLVCTDVLGNRGAEPAARIEPEVTVIVDTHPPELLTFGPKRGDVVRGEAIIDLGWEARDPNLPQSPVNIRQSEDGRVSWSTPGINLGVAGRHRLNMPAKTGPVVIEVTAADEAGNVASVETEILVDATQPEVSVSNLDRVLFAGGEKAEIRWTALDDHFGEAPISIMICRGGTGRWDYIERECRNTGAFTFAIPPENSSDCAIKVIARDKVGNQNDAVTEKTFSIDSSAPVVHITTTGLFGKREVAISFEARDIGDAGLDRVEISVSKDGNKWEQAAVATGSERSVVVTLPEGVSLLHAVGHDKVGNSSPPPGALSATSIRVDTTPPEISVSGIEEGALVPGNFPVQFSWNAGSVDALPAPVRVSAKIGPTGSWEVIASERPAIDSLKWLTPGADVDCRLRAEVVDAVGNTFSREVGFFVDATPPTLELLGPDILSAAVGSTVTIAWRYEDAHPASKPISLYFSAYAGETYEAIALDIKNDGTFSYKLPNEPAGECFFKVVAVDAVGNRSEAVSRKPFGLVAGLLTPEPRIAQLISRRPFLVEYTCHEVKDYPVDVVELYVTPDDGRNWNPPVRQTKVGAPFELDLQDGRYGVFFVARSSEHGLSSPAPAPGTRPAASFVVDTSAPEIRLFGVKDGDTFVPRSEITISWECIDANKEQMTAKLELRLGDDDWKPVGEFGTADSHKLTAPDKPTMLGIRVSAVDPAGNKAESAVSLRVGIAAPTKVVASTTARDAAVYPPGQVIGFEWSGEGGPGSTTTVEIQLSPDGGTSWHTLFGGLPSEGKRIWETPEETIDLCSVRIVARDTDLAGDAHERVVLEPVSFSVDASPPAIELDIPERGGAEIAVGFSATDTGKAGVAIVELWITMDSGLSWKRTDETATAASGKFTFKPPDDGTYGFYAVVVDAVGNRSVAPEPHSRPIASIIVETKGPEVRLKNFLGGEKYPGGANLVIGYEATDANLKSDPISIFYSEDSGKTWRAIVEKTRNSGMYYWSLPSVTCSSFRIRVVAEDMADNKGQAESSTDFVIDSSRPVVFFASSHTITKSRTCVLPYQLSGPSGVGLDTVTVWHKEVAADDWAALPPVKVDPSKFELTFEAPSDGEFDIYVCGRNEVGSETPSPSATSVPQHTVLVDSSPPVVKLIAPKGGEIKSTAGTLRVAWSAADERLSDRPVRLEVSPDAGQTWQLLAEVANTGEAEVELPKGSGSYLLRVCATDVADNVGMAQTEEPLVFDNMPPAVKILSARMVDKLVEVEYEITDEGGSGLQVVELWLSPQQGRAWKKAGEADADLQSPFLFPVPAEDGTYGIRLVATDRAGNHSPEPLPEDTGEAVFATDRKAPAVVLKSFIGGEVLRGGSVADVDWEALDENLAEAPVAIEISSNGGRSWSPLAGP
ncbi:MAG: Ig-like domain-containing protein, partial [Planctomycetota bacterium]|nr:Ig-like domain-containing protein [Planctomycetota bacterium]